MLSDTVLSQAISIRRLRSYEEICRNQAQCEPNEFSRTELEKLAETFHRAASDLEPVLEAGSR